MGEHHYGFYTGDLMECFEKVYDNSNLRDKYIKENWIVDGGKKTAIISLILESYTDFQWQHSHVILAEPDKQSETLQQIRNWLHNFTADKDSFTERDVRYMQQYLSAQGCPREDRRLLNHIIGVKNIHFGILE